MILATVAKTVVMFVALADMTSFDMPVTEDFCHKMQKLVDEEKDFAVFMPELSHSGRPLAVLCLDPEAGE